MKLKLGLIWKLQSLEKQQMMIILKRIEVLIKGFPQARNVHLVAKKIPTLVCWSVNGSITSEILQDSLATMDHYELFPRSGNLKPFLLLDGHGSRFEKPFLRYVTDREHPWMVCQGVPYGTSLWQVADSSEQNGSFKAASSHIKMEIQRKRLDMMMDNPSILAIDIIPLVNYAWKDSFTRVKSNRKNNCQLRVKSLEL